MNKGEPLNININILDGALKSEYLEFFPKAKTVEKRNPKSRAKIPK